MARCRHPDAALGAIGYLSEAVFALPGSTAARLRPDLSALEHEDYDDKLTRALRPERMTVGGGRTPRPT